MIRYDVTKYGVISCCESLQTEKIQRLIDSLPEEGGEIYFPRGRYVISTLHLRSNLVINVAKGAYLLGSLNFYDFDRIEPVAFSIYQDVSHTYFRCALLYGEKLHDITIKGSGVIDMRSVWDEDNVLNNSGRGAKVISIKECDNVLIQGLRIRNATDLAVYFAGCNHVTVRKLDMNVYIDGVSPDNSKDVLVEDCYIRSGDDGLVFKSSYNLNRLDECRDIVARRCKIKSRCNAIKFGTESNGGFKNFIIEDMHLENVRFAGICIESVDGADIDNINISNIKMVNVNAPLFIHLGNRLRGPEGTEIGHISNVTISDLNATGPYRSYRSIPFNHKYFKRGDYYQDIWEFGQGANKPDLSNDPNESWQFTSNICGLKGHYLENITLNNVHLEVFGNIATFNKDVSEKADGYPEVYVYGKILPASGLYFRHVKNLITNNVTIDVIHDDMRDTIVKDDVIDA